MNCVNLDKPAYATLEASNVVKQTETLNYHCCPAAWEDQLDQIDHDGDIVYGDRGHGDGQMVMVMVIMPTYRVPPCSGCSASFH